MTPFLPELLSPAGDMDKLVAAVAYGADAVYAGGRRFGLRQASRNFSDSELFDAVSFVHERDRKFYLTVNATPRTADLNDVAALIDTGREAGVDAFIIADLGVMSIAQERAPGVPIHMSTQTGVLNAASARRLVELGAKRLVLARELSLDEIAAIRRALPKEAEIEVFVHGAMCMSYSGRCILSNYMTARDANGGACAQPCRWKYTLMEEKRPGEYFPVFEDDDGTYLFNAKDLCLIKYLDRLHDAGVTSFKIEGRVKTAYYTAVVTRAYRRALDDLAAGRPFDEGLLTELCKASHRDYCTGFLLGPLQNGQIYRSNAYTSDAVIAATVEDVCKGKILCRTKNPFSVGDTLELLTPDGVFPLTVASITRPDGSLTPLANHPEEIVSVPFDREITRPAFLRKPVA